MQHRALGFLVTPVLASALLALACSADADSSSWDWGGAGGSAGSAGSAGTAGAAGVAGQGGAAAAAGQAGTGAGGGSAGQAGAPPSPSVSILNPSDGATVQNPVAFAFEAHDVTSVELVADGQYPIDLGWDPTQSPTHSMAYSFSGLGQRTLTLNGYLGGPAPAASQTIQIEVVAPPLCDGFSSDSLITPNVCDGPSGNTSTEIPSNGLYASSWFGCYRKSDGTIYEDPYDNCEFACGSMGYCPSGQSGPNCEADLMWFAADADRYGCGGLIRATNCDNGRAVVLVTLDRGPNCGSVEQPCDAPVLDMSHPAMEYLFEGGMFGGCDHQRVVVEEVPDGTPLGPVN